MNNFQLGKKRSNDIIRFVENYESITINQCANLFYSGANTAYKIAQRKLNKLANAGYLKISQNNTNNNMPYNVYYIKKKLSHHDLLINSFLIALIKAGATNITFEKSKQWLHGKLISDAYLHYDYTNYHYFNILEVCYKNKYIPIKSYEELFKSGEAHKVSSGTFPRLIVMDDIEHNPKYYKSQYFQIIQIDLDLKKLPAIFVD